MEGRAGTKATAPSDLSRLPRFSLPRVPFGFLDLPLPFGKSDLDFSVRFPSTASGLPGWR